MFLSEKLFLGYIFVLILKGFCKAYKHVKSYWASLFKIKISNFKISAFKKNLFNKHIGFASQNKQ